MIIDKYFSSLRNRSHATMSKKIVKIFYYTLKPRFKNAVLYGGGSFTAQRRHGIHNKGSVCLANLPSTSFLVLIDLLASCIINIHQASRTSSIIHNTHTLFTYTRLLELLPSYSLHFQNFYHHTRLFHFFITAGVSPLIDTKFHIKLLLKSNSKTKISYFTIHKNSMFQNKQCSSYLCPIHPRNLGMLLTMTLFLDFDNVAAT